MKNVCELLVDGLYSNETERVQRQKYEEGTLREEQRRKHIEAEQHRERERLRAGEERWRQEEDVVVATRAAAEGEVKRLWMAMEAERALDGRGGEGACGWRLMTMDICPLPPSHDGMVYFPGNSQSPSFRG